MHEIVEAEDSEYIDLNNMIDMQEIEDAQSEEEKEPQIKKSKKPNQDIDLKPNEKLEVVKITRCKMRSRDTLEIEIGLKNIVLRHKQFEERKFALRFLNKIDP